ncbi:hypothetical protein CRG98_009613 [Punica granatum]|uniref:peroxidase n=1 Tax=Punica granatum TaxID=22663 RepID=A0A2I0KNV6_PUNGR|nr:hypothetical protein CRG98_009613 [Punica granatum]
MANKCMSILLVLPILAFAPASHCRRMSGGYLYPQFYHFSCQRAQDIVNSVVAKAVAQEVRIAASLLWLHFHDCFVKKLSSRFEVIDEIKSALEKECPNTVSCADILALAARDSTVLAGGPSWEVPLGRRDSRKASLSVSNNDIPALNETFVTILNNHTIGNARCTGFRQRLYNQSGNSQPDFTLDQSYAYRLRSSCPSSGMDDNLFSLD